LYSGDEIENGKGAVSSIYGRDGYRVLVRKPEGKSPLGSLDVNGRIILRGILRKWDGGWYALD